MRRSSGPWARRTSSLLAVGLLASGCVTRGTHGEVVDERDALAERVRLLEASQESLSTERVELMEEMENLRSEREDLEEAVGRLRRAEAELSERLAHREAELASRSEELDQLRSTYQGLVKDLEAELADGQIEIEQLREGLQLNMAQDILFPSGSAEVNSGGRALLGKVAQRVKEVPYYVVVQGHTDNVPIRAGRYPSNWELAAARASRVVRILRESGVDPARLSAVSYGEHRPRESNDSSEGRARNRRIEVTLMPMPGAGSSRRSGAQGAEEAPAAAAP